MLVVQELRLIDLEPTDISSRPSRGERNSAPRYDGGRADGGGAALAFVVVVVAFSVVVDGAAARDRNEAVVAVAIAAIARGFAPYGGRSR